MFLSKAKINKLSETELLDHSIQFWHNLKNNFDKFDKFELFRLLCYCIGDSLTITENSNFIKLSYVEIIDEFTKIYNSLNFSKKVKAFDELLSRFDNIIRIKR